MKKRFTPEKVDGDSYFVLIEPYVFEERWITVDGPRRTGGIASLRNLLYMLARLLGDVNAIQKGKVMRRIGRRIAGKATGRALGRLFK